MSIATVGVEEEFSLVDTVTGSASAQARSDASSRSIPMTRAPRSRSASYDVGRGAVHRARSPHREGFIAGQRLAGQVPEGWLDRLGLGPHTRNGP